MNISGGDWLTNAALIGYCRVQNLELKPDSDSVQIKEADLKGFTDKYFNAALKQYMQNSFVLNKENRDKLTKFLDKEQKKTFYDELQKFTNNYDKEISLKPKFADNISVQIKLLESYKKELKFFLNKIQKEFKIKKQTIDSVFKNNNEKIEKKMEAINDQSCKFIPNSLARFYFNKKIVGNYSLPKTISRNDAFDEEYVLPAISTLKNPLENGHTICKICKQNKVNITSFATGILSEGMFSSSMVSDSKFKNFFYNGQADLFICKVCELLLLCTWAGFNPIPLYARDDTVNADYIFVNTSDIRTTQKQNNAIREQKHTDDASLKDDIYKTVLGNLLVNQHKQKSKWVLNGCFFVELKTVVRKNIGKPDFRYFHIDRSVANLFQDKNVTNAFTSMSKTTLYINKKFKKKLSITVLDMILSNKGMNDIFYKLCKQQLESTFNMSKQLFNTCLISAIRSEYIKKHRGQELSENIGRYVFKNLEALKRDGNSLANNINTKSDNTKKSKSLSYVLLESIRNNNMNKFFDLILKLYLTNNLPVPNNMMSLLDKHDDTVIEKTYAFMSGFCSNNGKK